MRKKVYISISIFLFAVFAKILGFAIKATWGLTKILLTLVTLPIVLIAIAIAGFYKCLEIFQNNVVESA